MNHIKSVFEKIGKVRALVRSGQNDQAIKMAIQLLQNEDIPSFSRQYLEHIINAKIRPRYNLSTSSNKAASNELSIVIQEKVELDEPHYGLVQNGHSLVGILKSHGIQLIRICASPEGDIDFIATSCQDFHRIKFCLNQAANSCVSSEAILTRLGPTSQEVKVSLHDIDISNKCNIEVQYSLSSSPQKTISIRSDFISLQSFCPVALACSSAKKPKYQDMSLINFYLLRYELVNRPSTREHVSTSQEGHKLYCVDISDTSLSIRDILSTDPYLYENLDISRLESLIKEVEPSSILLIKDSSVLLREDISQVIKHLVANENQSLLGKAILLDHLIKDVNSDNLFFTNYETIKGLSQDIIPKTNMRVKTCLLSVDLFSETFQQIGIHERYSADQYNANLVGLIIDTLIEFNHVCFSFKDLIGIQYLPEIPAEQKRFFQQSPHSPLQASCNQDYYAAQSKDIGILGLSRMSYENIEQLERQPGSKIINIEDYTQFKSQGSSNESSVLLHHGEILIDAKELVNAVTLSGVSYVAFIHPEFDLGYSRYFEEQVALIQSCPLCISVSPHIYERKSQKSSVTKIILGETFECLQTACVRIIPESFPTCLAEGLMPIQVPPLIGSVFDAEYLAKALSGQHLCSTRDIQALLSVEAHKNGYQQILSSRFTALYTSVMPYKSFNSISEEVSRKVNLSGVTSKLPLVCTSFKAKHD